jgi:hypothetical protein
VVESDDDLLGGRIITEEVGEGGLGEGDGCVRLRRIDSLMELLVERGRLEDKLRLSSESATYRMEPPGSDDLSSRAAYILVDSKDMLEMMLLKASIRMSNSAVDKAFMPNLACSYLSKNSSARSPGIRTPTDSRCKM